MPPSCPLDARLTARERRAIVDLARPASVVTADDEVLFADPAPPEPDRVGLVDGDVRHRPAARSSSSCRDRPSRRRWGCSFAALGSASGGVALEPSEPWVCCLSPAHIGGMLVLMRHVVFGTPVTVLDRIGLDPDDAMREVPAGAHVALVPTMLHRLLEAGADLSRFGILLIGGAAVDTGHADVAGDRGVRVVSTYGLTESCGGIAYDGRLFDDTSARIDASGGVQLHGPTIMEGYRHDPAATAVAFTLDGWLRTGDTGELRARRPPPDRRPIRRGDPDGRRDGVAARGRGRAPGPSEGRGGRGGGQAARGVGAAGRGVRRAGERRRSAEPGGAARCTRAERIARFKLPRSVVSMTELPRTASGKIRRGALPR